MVTSLNSTLVLSPATMLMIAPIGWQKEGGVVWWCWGWRSAAAAAGAQPAGQEVPSDTGDLSKVEVDLNF